MKKQNASLQRIKTFAIFYRLIFIIYILSPFVNEGRENSNSNSTCDNFSVKISLKVKLPYKVSESSGLVYTNGKLWTHNDSGGFPWIYSVDTATGKILQTVIITNYQNIDWEDITADSSHIYIGDFGNNAGMRKNLRILVIEKSDIIDKPVVRLKAKSINFSYADQDKFDKNYLNNFDCESILSIGDSLYLFSKDRGDNRTRVYRISKTPGNFVISPYTSYNVNGRISGACINEKKNELALLGYQVGATNSFIMLINNFKGTDFFSGGKRRMEIGNDSIHWKTEGITYENDTRLFISCEKLSDRPAGLYICELPE